MAHVGHVWCFDWLHFWLHVPVQQSSENFPPSLNLMFLVNVFLAFSQFTTLTLTSLNGTPGCRCAHFDPANFGTFVCYRVLQTLHQTLFSLIDLEDDFEDSHFRDSLTTLHRVIRDLRIIITHSQIFPLQLLCRLVRGLHLHHIQFGRPPPVDLELWSGPTDFAFSLYSLWSVSHSFPCGRP